LPMKMQIVTCHDGSGDLNQTIEDFKSTFVDI